MLYRIYSQYHILRKKVFRALTASWVGMPHAPPPPWDGTDKKIQLITNAMTTV